MKKIILLLLFAFIISNMLCKSEKQEDVPATNLSSSITFDIPSSVSATQEELEGSLSSKNLARFVNREDDGTKEILGGVRLFAGIAESFAGEAKKFFLEMEKNLGPLIENQKWVESKTGGKLAEGIVFDFDEDGQKNRIKIALTDNFRHIKMWSKDMVGNPKVFEATWQGSVQDGKVKSASGTLYMNGGLMGGMPAGSIIKMEFDTDNSTWGHSMKIQSAGFFNDDPTDDIDDNNIKNMYLFAAKKDGEVVLVGNAYFPYFGEASNDKEDFFADDESRSYVYSASSNVEKNIGLMKVALPVIDANPQDYSTIFGTYSVGDIYKQMMWDWLHDSTDSEAVGILAALEAPIPNGFGTNAVNTVDKLETVLNNSVFDTNAEVKKLRFAFSLDNPVYTDSSGYIGNGDSEPAGYSALLTNVDKASSELISLTDVVGLKTVLWGEFTETMPTDNEVKSLD